MTRGLAYSALLMALLPAAMAMEGGSVQEVQALDILFIGNSYTGNLRSMFTRFMGDVAPQAHLEYRTGGGCTGAAGRAFQRGDLYHQPGNRLCLGKV